MPFPINTAPLACLLVSRCTANTSYTHHFIAPNPYKSRVSTRYFVLDCRYFRNQPTFLSLSSFGYRTLFIRKTMLVSMSVHSSLIKNRISVTSMWKVCVFSSLSFLAVSFASNRWLTSRPNVLHRDLSFCRLRTIDKRVCAIYFASRDTITAGRASALRQSSNGLKSLQIMNQLVRCPKIM